MPGPRTSMNQLAKAAGVSVSTVSRALRSQPSIPEATRRRIQQLAEKFGYKPDPMLNALYSYRKGVTRSEYRPTLAMVATGADWKESLACRLYHEGARRRAEDLGYQIEVFVVEQRKLSCQRLVGILETRSVRGVLTLPILDVSVNLDLLPQKFLVVALGYKFKAALINRVSINHFSAMGQALEQLAALGYRKPGLVLRCENPRMAPSGVTHVGKLWEGGYLAERTKLFPDLDLPVVKPADALQLERWLEKTSPDVLISQDRKVTRWMAERHVGFPVAYTMVDDDPTLTGIHQNSLQVGRRAVDLLVADLYRTETDSTTAPVTLLVGTTWNAGSTAPHQAPGRAAAISSNSQTGHDEACPSQGERDVNRPFG